MSDRLKERADVQPCYPKLFQMADPRQQGLQPVNGLAVIVVLRSPGQPERIYVIKNTLIIPSHQVSPFGALTS